jgi:XisH protein
MARDLLHNSVKEALLKEGWHITNDPLRIPIDGTYLEVDMAAEIIFGAERGDEKIAIEVKSFLKKSFMTNFHEAIGQYLDYKSAMEDFEPERIVFLALPLHAYNNSIFQGRFIQKRLREEETKLIIFDPLKQEIVQWIKN